MRRSILLTVITLFAIFPTLSFAQDTVSVEETNTAIVMRLIDDVWNAQNPDRDILGSIVEESFALIFESHSGPQINEPKITSRAWLTNRYGYIHQAFPDMHITVENLIAQGDMVVVHYQAQGTFSDYLPVWWFLDPTESGELIPATNEMESWDGIFMYRLEDGKIIEEYWYWDRHWIEIMQHGLDK